LVLKNARKIKRKIDSITEDMAELDAGLQSYKEGLAYSKVLIEAE